jgi:hypothetical protein
MIFLKEKRKMEYKFQHLYGIVAQECSSLHVTLLGYEEKDDNLIVFKFNSMVGDIEMRMKIPTQLNDAISESATFSDNLQAACAYALLEKLCEGIQKVTNKVMYDSAFTSNTKH